MRLYAYPLNDVNDVNSFEIERQIEITEGDIVTFYFQIIDKSVWKDHNPLGRRYIPADVASLSITMKSIDSDETITADATQPFSEDLSIWSVDLDTEDTVAGTYGMSLELTEGQTLVDEELTGGTSKFAWIPSVLVIHATDPEF